MTAPDPALDAAHKYERTHPHDSIRAFIAGVDWMRKQGAQPTRDENEKEAWDFIAQLADASTPDVRAVDRLEAQRLIGMRIARLAGREPEQRAAEAAHTPPPGSVDPGVATVEIRVDWLDGSWFTHRAGRRAPEPGV